MNISKEGFIKFSKLNTLLEYKTLMFLLANASEDGSSSVKQNDIAYHLNTTRQAVNRSINKLAKNDVFSIEKVGLRRVYHLNPDYFITTLGYKELYKQFIKHKSSNKENDNE